jgi:hypothetical protein
MIVKQYPIEDLLLNVINTDMEISENSYNKYIISIHLLKFIFTFSNEGNGENKKKTDKENLAFRQALVALIFYSVFLL